jgi:hypothetical protein
MKTILTLTLHITYFKYCYKIRNEARAFEINSDEIFASEFTSLMFYGWRATLKPSVCAKTLGKTVNEET